MRSRSVFCVATLVMGAATAFDGSECRAGKAPAEVRVYTNEDLSELPDVPAYTNKDVEDLEPVPTGQAQAWDEDLGWDFVLQFIERQRAKLEQEQARSFSRELIEQERERERELARERYSLPWLYGFGLYREDYERDRLVGLAQDQIRNPLDPKYRLTTPLHARPGGTIKPLHARQPLPRGRGTAYAPTVRSGNGASSRATGRGARGGHTGPAPRAGGRGR